MEIIPDLKAFGIGGLAMMMSTLDLNNGATSQSASGPGIIFGGGALYNIGSFGVGGQLQVLYGEQDFGDVTVNTGSTQLQLIGTYSF